MFVEGIKKALKARGVRLKMQDLKFFFIFVKEVCQWFPTVGTIDEKGWKRVGDALQDYYRTSGLEKKIPIIALSY